MQEGYLDLGGEEGGGGLADACFDGSIGMHVCVQRGETPRRAQVDAGAQIARVCRFGLR